MGGVRELLDGRVVGTEHSAEGLGQTCEKSARLSFADLFGRRIFAGL